MKIQHLKTNVQVWFKVFFREWNTFLLQVSFLSVVYNKAYTHLLIIWMFLFQRTASFICCILFHFLGQTGKSPEQNWETSCFLLFQITKLQKKVCDVVATGDSAVPCLKKEHDTKTWRKFRSGETETFRQEGWENLC